MFHRFDAAHHRIFHNMIIFTAPNLTMKPKEIMWFHKLLKQ